MKRTVSLLLTAIFLLSLCCSMLTSCAPTPEVEDLYDRVVYLIEEATEINTVIFGPGVPVYEKESEYVILRNIYFDFSQTSKYEKVTPYTKFYTVEQIKARAEKVYSRAYLEEVVYKTLFDGYAIEDGQGGAAYGFARYQTFGNDFCMSSDDDENGNDKNVKYTATRTYDYSTMEVLSLGREDACRVKINSWLDSSPERVEAVEISLILQDGQWYLDSFTGA